MADQPAGPLAEAARAIGSAAGKIVAAVSGAVSPAPSTPAKANLWKADYIGSGTFLIHKPKRKAHKRRQQAVKNPRRGMR